MGITSFEHRLLQQLIKTYKPKSVCELGSQNLYISNGANPPFASEFYEGMGIKYQCIDLAGDNNAIVADLSRPLELHDKFDLVTDFGSSEHVVQMQQYQSTAFHEGYINSIYPVGKVTEENIENGIYNCWLNKHNLLDIGGIMVNVNPKTGNWPNHGYSFYSKEFYRNFQAATDYHVFLLDEHAAMGNTVDGWNVVCVMQKKSEKFIGLDEFNSMGLCRS